ncbi:hypothetical protein [Paenibacillus arenosi]|uniref:Uncharacterized protein n=1 Tax=Paenibacillus arenosi TaxID=2774142 RepID=A0ABR9AS50_9BACL|nr:hypothetical protein [Paenibacillus arenosi]MBD8496952.1 hypothetical protein [Paenibacillus arenosi]
MTYKYALIDTENGMVVGRCTELKGLTGAKTEQIDGEEFNKITFIDFSFTDHFIEICNNTKMYINNLDLTIINNEGNPIGVYYFYLREPFYFHKSGFSGSVREFDMVGTLPM